MHVEFREQLSDVGSSNQVSSSNPVQVVGLETSALKTGSHLAVPRSLSFLKGENSSLRNPYSWLAYIYSLFLSTSFAFPSKSHF